MAIFGRMLQTWMLLLQLAVDSESTSGSGVDVECSRGHALWRLLGCQLYFRSASSRFPLPAVKPAHPKANTSASTPPIRRSRQMPVWGGVDAKSQDQPINPTTHQSLKQPSQRITTSQPTDQTTNLPCPERVRSKSTVWESESLQAESLQSKFEGLQGAGGRKFGHLGSHQPPQFAPASRRQTSNFPNSKLHPPTDPPTHQPTEKSPNQTNHRPRTNQATNRATSRVTY